MNTKNHSIEIYYPINITDDSQNIEKKLVKFAEVLFSLNILNADFEELKKRMIGIGKTHENNEELTVQDDVVEYFVMEGKCLDEENLSYFIPRNIIKKGKLTILEFEKFLKIS